MELPIEWAMLGDVEHFDYPCEGSAAMICTGLVRFQIHHLEHPATCMDPRKMGAPTHHL
jgi:hypothetical protein